MKTAILIDSTFASNKKELSNKNLYVIPLTINFENTTYTDKGDKDKLVNEIFQKIKEEKTLPSTSQPATGEFVDIYNQIIKDGYKKIVAFHISSKLSGTTQGSLTAAEMVMEENEGVQIDVFDSLNVVISSIAVKEISKELKYIDDLSNEKIQSILEYYSKNTKTLLSVDTLEYLAMGGRISSSVAAIGNLFGIKPLLEIKEGEILEFAKARSQKKAYQKMIETFEEDILSDKNAIYQISVLDALNQKSAKKLYSMMVKILEKNDIEYEEGYFSTLSPVIANHTGPGSVGISWSKKYEVS